MLYITLLIMAFVVGGCSLAPPHEFPLEHVVLAQPSSPYELPQKERDDLKSVLDDLSRLAPSISPNQFLESEIDARALGVPESVIQRFDAVALISVGVEGDNTWYNGSGFLIAPDFILTAFHVFETYEEYFFDERLRIEVSIGGKTIEGFIPDRRFFFGKSGPDLILIKLKERVAIDPIPFASALPEFGDPLYVVGYAMSSFRHFVLIQKYRGIIEDESSRGNGFRHIITEPSVASGNSGGPLLDKDGKVVGVITTGWSNIFGMVLSAEYVKDLLGQVLNE